MQARIVTKSKLQADILSNQIYLGQRELRPAERGSSSSPKFRVSPRRADSWSCPCIEIVVEKKKKQFGGADGIRTHDLLDAIEARSQLRHGPTGGTQLF